MDLKSGDVVRLNSGGVAMTVEEIIDDIVSCIWMSGGTVRRDAFKKVLLTKVTGAGDAN